MAITCTGVQGAELTFGYWIDASQPFVFKQNQQLSDGLLKDMGDALAAALAMTPRYHGLPLKRIEPQLHAGELHVLCYSNPKWMEQPGEVHWSPPLLRGRDVFVQQRASAMPIGSFTDLAERRMGVYLGYRYNETLMRMIDQGQIPTFRVNDLPSGLRALRQGHIDVLVDIDLVVAHHLQAEQQADVFEVATLPADEFDVHCAYSKRAPVMPNRLDKALLQLKNDGTLDAIIRRYRY